MQDADSSAETEPGAETVPTVSLSGPARWTCYCRWFLLRLPNRERINGRGCVRHFLMGRQVLRPFISLRMPTTVDGRAEQLQVSYLD
ncbi:uncharacterized protein V6R79_005587 [Siganus canaliculatus]